MAKGVLPGVVIGTEKYKDKNNQERVSTTVMCGSQYDIYSVNCNGFKDGSNVFLHGDFRRTREGRNYCKDGGLIPRKAEQDHDWMVKALQAAAGSG